MSLDQDGALRDVSGSSLWAPQESEKAHRHPPPAPATPGPQCSARQMICGREPEDGPKAGWALSLPESGSGGLCPKAPPGTPSPVLEGQSCLAGSLSPALCTHSQSPGPCPHPVGLGHLRGVPSQPSAAVCGAWQWEGPESYSDVCPRFLPLWASVSRKQPVWRAIAWMKLGLGNAHGSWPGSRWAATAWDCCCPRAPFWRWGVG